MNTHTRLIAAFISIQFSIFGTSTIAETFVNLNFEDGVKPSIGKGIPTWYLPPSFDKVYGEGNHFIVTDTTAHSGNYSLKFTYEARNNICNMCGTHGTKHKKGLNGVDYFVSNSDEDLTDKEKISTTKPSDGPAAQPGRILYNKTNGFSQWKITSVDNYAGGTNNKLSVKLINKGTSGKKPEFNSDDEIAIARQCGVDGHVARTINRRSDCDAVITWFGNITLGTQKPGGSIFRRVYLKSEITSPHIHQKLHYIRPDRGGPNAGDMVIFADSLPPAKSLQPIFSGLKRYGGEPIYKPGKNGLAANLSFERGTWYYMEEQYKAATLDLSTDPSGNTYNHDGVYRLWLYKSGEESTTPTLEVTGVSLPPILGDKGTHVSLWGNIQHWEHTRGSWYMDDIVVSDTKIGFSGTGGGPKKNTFSSLPPATDTK